MSNTATVDVDNVDVDNIDNDVLTHPLSTSEDIFPVGQEYNDFTTPNNEHDRLLPATSSDFTVPPQPRSMASSARAISWYLLMWNVVAFSGLAEALERYLSLEDAFGIENNGEPTFGSDSASQALFWSVIGASLIAWLTISATVHSHMTGRAEELDQEREADIAAYSGTLPMTDSNPEKTPHQGTAKTIAKRTGFVVLSGFSLILAGGAAYRGTNKFFEQWLAPSIGLSVLSGYIAAMRAAALIVTDLHHAKEHLWDKTPHAHLAMSMRLKILIHVARVAIVFTHGLYGIYESEEVIGPWLRKLLGELEGDCDWRTILVMLPFTLSQAVATSFFESDHIPTFRFNDLSFWSRGNVIAVSFALVALVATIINAGGHAAPSIAGSNKIFSCLGLPAGTATIAINAVLTAIEVVLDIIVHHRYLDDVMTALYNKLVAVHTKLSGACYGEQNKLAAVNSAEFNADLLPHFSRRRSIETESQSHTSHHRIEDSLEISANSNNKEGSTSTSSRRESLRS